MPGLPPPVHNNALRASGNVSRSSRFTRLLCCNVFPALLFTHSPTPFRRRPPSPLPFPPVSPSFPRFPLLRTERSERSHLRPEQRGGSQSADVSGRAVPCPVQVLPLTSSRVPVISRSGEGGGGEKKEKSWARALQQSGSSVWAPDSQIKESFFLTTGSWLYALWRSNRTQQMRLKTWRTRVWRRHKGCGT